MHGMRYTVDMDVHRLSHRTPLPHIVRSLGVCLLLLMFTAAPSAGSQVDPIESAIRQLQRAVERQPDGRHLGLLRSLRMLHDPALEPLFTRLSAHDDPLISIHGLLGLAEIMPDRRVSPDGIRSLQTEEARYDAIEQAIALNLIGEAELRQLLDGPSLGDVPDMLLMAQLKKLGGMRDVEPLRPMLDTDNDLLRGLAASLLMELGTPEPFQRFLQEMESMDEPTRERTSLWLIRDIARFDLRSHVPWIRAIVEEADPESTTAVLGVAALLVLDPAIGTRVWETTMRRTQSQLQRVRLALTLLDVMDTVPPPPQAPAVLRSGDPLLDGVAALTDAVLQQRDPTEQMKALIDMDHWAVGLRTINLAAVVRGVDRTAVYRHAIQRLEVSTHRPADRADLAIRSAKLLFTHDRESLREIVRESAPGSRQREVLLLALLECNDPQAGEIGRTLRRIGFDRADSLLLVLFARYEPTLSEQELRALGVLVGGGGRLSDAHMVQAAWLYLKHQQRTTEAITRLFVNPSPR